MRNSDGGATTGVAQRIDVGQQKKLHLLRMPEKNIVSEAKNGADNDDKKEDTNEFIALYNCQSCAECSANCVADSHRDGD